ncbi:MULTISPECIES: hypothetical protein [unclassified Micromonospora]|uniref:hypothetical protein n=1 Tax=unclassified Micromonospora TaxID=2617518 RepID=UPI003A871E02
MPDDDTTRSEDATLSRDDRSADVPSDTMPTGATRAIARWERLRNRLPALSYPHSVRPTSQSFGATLRNRPGARTALAAAVVCALGVVAAVESTAAAPEATGPAPAAAEADLQRRADAADGASRAQRPEPGDGEPAAAAAVQAAETTEPPADPDVAAVEPTETAEPAPEPTSTTVAPVAGLSQVQMDNATAIVDAGLALQLPRRAMVIAVATAMQESTLLNRASEVLPESKNYPHQGTGWDHDSVGLFQQRTSTGWGAVADLMNPTYSATQFYLALQRVAGWEQLPLTVAAQAVQVSAYPGHYAQHEAAADAVVTAVLAAR